MEEATKKKPIKVNNLPLWRLSNYVSFTEDKMLTSQNKKVQLTGTRFDQSVPLLINQHQMTISNRIVT